MVRDNPSGVDRRFSVIDPPTRFIAGCEARALVLEWRQPRETSASSCTRKGREDLQSEEPDESISRVSRSINGHERQRQNSLNHPVVDIVVHVDGDLPSVLVLGRNDLHGPEHHGERDEHGVVRDVPPDASPLPKAVHDVALVLRVLRTRRERRAVRSEVPRRVEERRVLAVDIRVLVAQPDVHEAHGPFRDEHALIPVVLDGTMRDPYGQNGPPSEDLFDHGAQVGQAGEIGE